MYLVVIALGQPGAEETVELLQGLGFLQARFLDEFSRGAVPALDLALGLGRIRLCGKVPDAQPGAGELEPL
jgi:hypothetical protein